MWMTVSLIKCEIHQGDKYLRFIAWSLRLFFSFLPKGTGQTRNTTSPSESRHHGTKTTGACIYYTSTQRKMSRRQCFDFLRSVSSSHFTGGFVCRGQVRFLDRSPALIPNPDTVTWQFVTHTHMHSNTGPEESGYKFVDTDRKVKNWNTASGLNINCSRGFLSSG